MTPHTPGSLPLLDLTLRPDLDVLLGRWGYQPEDTAELLACYHRLAAVALETRCRFWLQDLRRRVVNHHPTQEWLLNQFYPDMARQLGGRLFVAYLFNPSLHRRIMEAPDYAPPEAYHSKPYSLNFFGDEGAAIRWLQESQRQ